MVEFMTGLEPYIEQGMVEGSLLKDFIVAQKSELGIVESVFSFVHEIAPILCGPMYLRNLAQRIHNIRCGHAKNKTGLETTDEMTRRAMQAIRVSWDSFEELNHLILIALLRIQRGLHASHPRLTKIFNEISRHVGPLHQGISERNQVALDAIDYCQKALMPTLLDIVLPLVDDFCRIHLVH